MITMEEERGHRLQFAHIKKNKKQHECCHQRKLNDVCLTVTDVCNEGEEVAAVRVKALCSFEGYNNLICSGGVCSRHGAKQIRTCRKEGCTK